MKHIRPSLLFISILSVLLLSACAGAMGASSWPGITANDENVYVSYGSEVMALRAGNGNLIWRYPAKADARVTYYAAPAVTTDLVLAGDYANTLHALRRGTGEEAWSFTGAKGRFIASPLVQDDRVYTPNADHLLYALDLQGNLIWTFTTGQGLWAQPASDGQVLYQPSMDHSIYAIQAQDGSQVWKTELGGAGVATPALSDQGVLYVGTLTNELLALNAVDGQVLWRTNTKEAVWTTPTLHDNRLYFGDLSGTVYALNADTGDISWQMELDGGVIARAVVTGEGVVFVTENGTIQAVSFNGEKLWNKTINGKLYSSPAVVDNRIIMGVVRGDNLLVAFDFDGSELWSYTPAKK